MGAIGTSVTVTPVTVTIAYSNSFWSKKRTFKYWKSSDAMAIAYSETFDNPHHCPCNRSSLYRCTGIMRIFFSAPRDHSFLSASWSDLRTIGNCRTFRPLENLQLRRMTPTKVKLVPLPQIGEHQKRWEEGALNFTYSHFEICALIGIRWAS